jgi:hypothetical protein
MDQPLKKEQKFGIRMFFLLLVFISRNLLGRLSESVFFELLIVY